MESSEPTAPAGDTIAIVVAWIFYILALATLAVGCLVGLTLINYQVDLTGSLGALGRLGAASVLEAVGQTIKAALAFAGTIVLLVSLIISALLFACGQLLQRSRDLARRVRRLEALAASNTRALPAG
jgi:hypothetical protein